MSQASESRRNSESIQAVCDAVGAPLISRIVYRKEMLQLCACQRQLQYADSILQGVAMTVLDSE